MHLLRKWATQFLYSSGGKSGSPSKIAPSALLTQGVQPGSTGQKLGAEEMNYLLAQLVKNSMEMKLSAFDTFRVFALPSASFTIRSPTNAENQAIRLGRNPANGRYYVVTLETSADTVAICPIDETTQTTGAISMGLPGTIIEICATFEPADDVAGAPGLYVVVSTDAVDDIYVWRSNSGGDPDAFVSVGTHNPGAGTGTASIVAAAHDSVNDALSIVVDYGGTIYCLRVADAGSPSLTTPTTEPTYDAKSIGISNEIQAAAGGGVTIFGYTRSSDNAIRFYSSTDGGDVWAATAGTISTTSGYLTDLQYFDDFLDYGPGFVAVVGDSFASELHHTVYHSDDGGDTWTQVFQDDYALGALTRARLIGECLVCTKQADFGANTVGIVSIATGARAVVFAGKGGSAVHRDRDMSRVMSWHVGDDDAFALSGPVGPLRTFDGSSFY